MAKKTIQETKENKIDSSPESASLESNVVGTSEPFYGDVDTARENFPRRILDGFKRDPNLRATPRGVIGANGKLYDVEAAAQATAESPLARKLKGRHLQMIAIGGSIGMFSQHYALEHILSLVRHRSFRRFREILIERWPSVSLDSLHSHWNDVVLYCASIGRDGCAIPCSWLLLCVFH